MSLRVALPLLLLIGNLGCSGAAKPVAELAIRFFVYAGAQLLNSVAVRATEAILDRLTGKGKDSQFTVDASDPSRGRFKALEFKSDDGSRKVTLFDVPAVKDSATGKWKIPPDYAAKVEAALK